MKQSIDYKKEDYNKQFEMVQAESSVEYIIDGSGDDSSYKPSVDTDTNGTSTAKYIYLTVCSN